MEAEILEKIQNAGQSGLWFRDLEKDELTVANQMVQDGKLDCENGYFKMTEAVKA